VKFSELSWGKKDHKPFHGTELTEVEDNPHGRWVHLHESILRPTGGGLLPKVENGEVPAEEL
jgi:hypothetical protein